MSVPSNFSYVYFGFIHWFGLIFFFTKNKLSFKPSISIVLMITFEKSSLILNITHFCAKLFHYLCLKYFKSDIQWQINTSVFSNSRVRLPDAPTMQPFAGCHVVYATSFFRPLENRFRHLQLKRCSCSKISLMILRDISCKNGQY